MKLLLDECVTRFVKRDLSDHEVHTVDEAGFKGLENGDLLRAASGTYDVLITVDQKLPYQQNVADLQIAILVLAAKRNSYARLKPLLPQALKALETIKPGDVIRLIKERKCRKSFSKDGIGYDSEKLIQSVQGLVGVR